MDCVVHLIERAQSRFYWRHVTKVFWYLNTDAFFAEKADVTISMNDEDFPKLMTGKLNAQTVRVLPRFQARITLTPTPTPTLPLPVP